MAEIIFEHESQFRIVNGALYITPNWGGNSDRVAMSCGSGAKFMAYIPSYGIQLTDGFPKTWNMVAKNTILRHDGEMYLYARVERDGANGMYIWSRNVYDIEGVSAETEKSETYYYIQVGHITAPFDGARTLTLEYGKYGQNDTDLGADGSTTLPYTWSDLFRLSTDENGNSVILFLHNVYNVIAQAITIAGIKISKILTSSSDAKEADTDKGGDNALVTGGFLSKWLQGISDIFLRKDQKDETVHQLTMGAAVSNDIRTKRFSATSGAIGGVGAGMWMLEDGTGIMETDLFYVRRAAYFRSLTIAEVKHMGGEVVLSAAACQIAYVVPCDKNGNATTATPSYYRCYFEKRANGREVYNEWAIGDQARCQRFNANGDMVEGSFYWRLVIGVGEDDDFYYVDLSYSDCADGSNAPKSNDNIVLFGHRNPDAVTYDRTCAQMYSTVGANAPSRTYYSLITSYDLTTASRIEHLGVVNPTTGEVEWVVGDGAHYIKYNTRTGLDIRTNSMTVVADGKDVNVGDVLGDNFHFITSSDKAPADNGEIATWIPADDIDPSDGWSLEEKDAHVGDYLITSDGFTYEFVRDDSGSVVSHGWQISSDPYLIHAQETANSAVKNLADMASDNIITRQEKLQIIQSIDALEYEYTSITEEAAKVGVDSSGYDVAYLRLRAFYNYFAVTSNEDSELINDQGTLVVYKMGDIWMVGRRMDLGQSFQSTGKDYYYELSELRKEITFAVRDSAVTFEKDVDQAIKDELDSITAQYAGVRGAINELNGKYNLIAQQGGGSISGLLSESNFSTIFAKHGDLYASIATYVTGEISGITLTADKIDFSAESITMFSQNFRISSKELSIYYDEASGKEVIVIDTDNLKLNADGAEFSGTIRANNGMIMGYSELNIGSHGTSANVISAADSLAMIRFDSSHNTVFLPPNPREGQIIRVYAIGDSRMAPTLNVRSSQYKIVKAGQDVSQTATIDHGHTGDFVFDDRGERGAGVWYYIAES